MGLGICGWATSRRVGAWFYSAGMTEARGPLTGPAWSARPTALTGRPGRQPCRAEVVELVPGLKLRRGAGCAMMQE